MFSISQIRERRPELSRRKLRLIHGGKNLARTLPLSTLKPDRRPFLETDSPETYQSPILNKLGPKDLDPPDELVWIHCSVGDEMHEEEDMEEVATEHVRGFFIFRKGSSLMSPAGYDRFPPWFRPV